MSNVLIGIIGVILFIGLALAGALILGDDFKSASSSSTAAALASQMKQSADAIMMYKLKTGARWAPAIETNYLVPRFLKTPAVNPSPWARANASNYFFAIHADNDVNPVVFREPGEGGRVLYAIIGPASDQKSKDICQAFADQFSNGTIQDYRNVSDPQPPTDMACIRIHGNDGATANNDWYAVFSRLEPTTTAINNPSGYTGP